MNTDNKTPEEAMNKPDAASSPNTGESSAAMPIPAAQTATTTEAATASANDKAAAERQDGGGAAKPQAQSDDNKESAVQNADIDINKDAKGKGEDAKAEKRKGGGPRRVSGVVVSDKADKTARVRIERRVKHALYGKVIRRRTHLQAHDADNKCRIGDMVTIEESPRFSKTKAWRVVAITPGGGR